MVSACQLTGDKEVNLRYLWLCCALSCRTLALELVSMDISGNSISASLLRSTLQASIACSDLLPFSLSRRSCRMSSGEQVGCISITPVNIPFSALIMTIMCCCDGRN